MALRSLKQKFSVWWVTDELGAGRHLRWHKTQADGNAGLEPAVQPDAEG